MANELEKNESVEAEDRAHAEAGVVDDSTGPEAPQQVEKQAEESEDDAPKEEPRLSAAERREAIANKVIADRRAMDEEALIPSSDLKRMYGDVETPAERLNPVETQPAKDVEAKDIPAPEKITLKVDGREVVVDSEQLKAKAQIAIASENILQDAKAARDEAKRELEEIRRLRADHSANPQSQPKPEEARAEDTKPATTAELDALIEAIQFGTKEEAAKALSQHGDAIENRVMQKLGNLDQRVEQAAQRREETSRAKADAQKIIDEFADESPDFKDSVRRQEVLFDETVNVMAENLFKIGLTKERLSKYADDYGLAPQAAVGKAYSELSADPRFSEHLPTSKQVLTLAATRVREDFGMPSPVRQQVAKEAAPAPDNSQFVAERIERKQAAQPQPRRSSILPGDNQKPQLSQEEQRRQAVLQMRTARRGR